MTDRLNKLVAISSDALGENLSPTAPPEIPLQLYDLLRTKNGFVAFESALRVFPLGPSDKSVDLTEWNADNGWRSAYGDLIGPETFFAEDIFGLQFCLRDDSVFSFDGECGAFEFMVEDMEIWARNILESYNYWTGYELAHAWQKQHGPLSPSERLMPKKPFIFGGAYDLANLAAVNAKELMLLRGDIAKQIAGLPDETKIRLKVID